MRPTTSEAIPSLSAVIEGLPGPALLLQGQAVVRLASQTALRALRIRPEDLPRPLAELCPEWAAALPAMPPWRSMESEVTRRGDDGEIHERLILRPVGGSALLLVQDETRLRTLETENAQTVRLASLGFMLAGVCHEISNPLAATYSMLQLLQQDAGADPQMLRRGLASITGNVQRIVEISRQLSGFSRAAAEPRRPIAVDPVIEEALSLARHESLFGAIVVEHHKDPSAVIRGNAREMQQVFLNILTNAAQAMDGVGRILITTRRLESPWIEVMIQDEGPGIRPEYLDRLFQPFFSTKPRGEGTGIGLTISNEIAHEHGGRIRAESTWGKGARFYVELPLWRREP